MGGGKGVREGKKEKERKGEKDRKRQKWMELVAYCLPYARSPRGRARFALAWMVTPMILVCSVTSLTKEAWRQWQGSLGLIKMSKLCILELRVYEFKMLSA